MSVTLPSDWQRFLVELAKKFSVLCLLVSLLLGRPCLGQEISEEIRGESTPDYEQSKEQLNVHWLYGAYVPKDVPLVSLTLYQRKRLFERQTFATPGIYVKASFLALMSQAKGTPYEWGGGLEGYGRRLGSNYTQFSIQNSFSSLGNAALGYEPRYDRCHCVGLGSRTRHAFMRNFLTYNHTEEELRPQFALYGAALAAGMLSSTWKPKGQLWQEGYHSVLTQAGFGMLSNWIGEFAPDIRRKLKKHRLGNDRQSSTANSIRQSFLGALASEFVTQIAQQRTMD